MENLCVLHGVFFLRLIEEITMKQYLKELGLHSLRVSYIMLDFSVFMGMSEETTKNCFAAGFYHDLGKLEVDHKIIIKPTELNEEEMSEIKKHVDYSSIGTSSLNHEAWLGVSEHHENFGGDGYPYRLKGDEISLIGRMMRIVDTFDALMTKRAYKEAFSYEETMATMEDEKKHFDPFLYAQFQSFIEAYRSHYYPLLDTDVVTKEVLVKDELTR